MAQGYVFKGYWEDISTLRSFLDANLLLAKRNSPFQLHVMAPVTAARILPPTKLIGTCKVCTVKCSVLFPYVECFPLQNSLGPARCVL